MFRCSPPVVRVFVDKPCLSTTYINIGTPNKTGHPGGAGNGVERSDPSVPGSFPLDEKLQRTLKWLGKNSSVPPLPRGFFFFSSSQGAAVVCETTDRTTRSIVAGFAARPFPVAGAVRKDSRLSGEEHGERGRVHDSRARGKPTHSPLF